MRKGDEKLKMQKQEQEKKGREKLEREKLEKATQKQEKVDKQKQEQEKKGKEKLEKEEKKKQEKEKKKQEKLEKKEKEKRERDQKEEQEKKNTEKEDKDQIVKEIKVIIGKLKEFSDGNKGTTAYLTSIYLIDALSKAASFLSKGSFTKITKILSLLKKSSEINSSKQNDSSTLDINKEIDKAIENDGDLNEIMSSSLTFVTQFTRAFNNYEKETDDDSFLQLLQLLQKRMPLSFQVAMKHLPWYLIVFRKEISTGMDYIYHLLDTIQLMRKQNLAGLNIVKMHDRCKQLISSSQDNGKPHPDFDLAESSSLISSMLNDIHGMIEHKTLPYLFGYTKAADNSMHFEVINLNMYISQIKEALTPCLATQEKFLTTMFDNIIDKFVSQAVKCQELAEKNSKRIEEWVKGTINVIDKLMEKLPSGEKPRFSIGKEDPMRSPVKKLRHTIKETLVRLMLIRDLSFVYTKNTENEIILLYPKRSFGQQFLTDAFSNSIVQAKKLLLETYQASISQKDSSIQKVFLKIFAPNCDKKDDAAVIKETVVKAIENYFTLPQENVAKENEIAKEKSKVATCSM